MTGDGFLGVVQFPHPGGEHKVDGQGWTGWNVNDHRRKFLLAEGSHVDAAGVRREGELVFWGEWEPPSELVADGSEDDRLPRHVVRPRFPGRPTVVPGLQNTDPNVFGDRFRYTYCKQQIKGKATTYLASLQPGSLVLFGSNLAGAFVLDTALVVGERPVEHSRLTWREVLAGSVSETYRAVTLEPMYSDPAVPETLMFTLYNGATFDEPTAGMYSFFPCLPVHGDRRPTFARPVVSLEGVIQPRLKQGSKGTRADPGAIRDIWRNVVVQVLEAGLMLGVRALEPERTRVPDHAWPGPWSRTRAGL